MLTGEMLDLICRQRSLRTDLGFRHSKTLGQWCRPDFLLAPPPRALQVILPLAEMSRMASRQIRFSLLRELALRSWNDRVRIWRSKRALALDAKVRSRVQLISEPSARRYRGYLRAMISRRFRLKANTDTTLSQAVTRAGRPLPERAPNGRRQLLLLHLASQFYAAFVEH